MSLIDKYNVRCDGPNCAAVAQLPIASEEIATDSELDLPMVQGWLFVLQQGSDRHFCPGCAPDYLRQRRK